MGNLVYRRREAVPVAVGVTLVVALGGRQFSPWAPWAAPVVGAAVAGWLIGNWRDGSGAGGYAAGIGGFLFVAALNWSLGLQAVVRRGLTLFVLFALVGLLVGAAFGFAQSYRLGRRGETRSGEAEATDEADEHSEDHR